MNFLIFHHFKNFLLFFDGQSCWILFVLFFVFLSVFVRSVPEPGSFQDQALLRPDPSRAKPRSRTSSSCGRDFFAATFFSQASLAARLFRARPFSLPGTSRGQASLAARPLGKVLGGSTSEGVLWGSLGFGALGSAGHWLAEQLAGYSWLRCTRAFSVANPFR